MAIRANSTTAPQALRDFLPPHPSPQLPSVVIVGELRALTVFSTVPRDCGAFDVEHDRFAPHLRIGEVAVIDPDDVEPLNGEIYVIKVGDPREMCGHVLRIVQLRSALLRTGRRGPDGIMRIDDEDSLLWWMHFDLLRPPRPGLTADELATDLAAGRLSFADGPMGSDGMRRKIIGRVVGVIVGSAA